MTHRSISQQIICFITGCVINIALFSLSKYAGFPLWTDFTGSLLITAVCGSILGILSVIIHTAILILIIDGVNALLLLPAILAVITVMAVFISKDSFNSPKGYFLCCFCSFGSAFVLNSVINLIFGMTGRYAVYGTAYTALHESVGKLFGSVIISAGVTFTELILSFAILALLLLIIPQKRDGLSFNK